MAKDWQELTRLTGGETIIIERVRIVDRDVSIEGSFELPPLARLSAEDQIFAAAFLRSHGSIKKMEETFGVSYPTIKNRLNRIGDQLDFVKIESFPERGEVLERLERGEITADEAVELLEGQSE
ncbi:MAG: DUF2089 domain-containing protein [Candidatus Zixiibacteriota bacterium]|nr:MAG: DUF2089 domain-containing protein [candidate division Zixibacteria bacterium]